MELSQNETVDRLFIDDFSKSYLLETAKWGKFLAIVGFVVCILIVCAGFFMGSFIASISSFYGAPAESTEVLSKVGPIMAFFYVLIAILYFIPCLYLYRFASKMKLAIQINNQENLTNSFQNLKSLYKYCAILTIVAIALYGLIFIFALVGFSMMK